MAVEIWYLFLLFLLLHFWREGWLGLERWSPCHPCDRSLLFGCHLLSLAFLEEGVAGFCGDGSRSTGWKEVRGILSFLGDVDGYFGGWQGCCFLSLVVGMRPFLFFYYYYCFLW